jgi:hypothetical protein
MSRLTAFARFLWEFVIGDDWRVAAGVAVALGITAAVAGAGVTAWWILPVAVVLLLGVAVSGAARGHVER